MDDVTPEAVDKILDDSIVTYVTMGAKTTIGHAQLPNGYEVTVTSSCINPQDYDVAIGVRTCKRKLRGEIADILAIECHDHFLDDYTD